MSYEPKNLIGALFKNDKEGNENRPDYRGDCCINGVEYQIGAWLKVSAKGTKFMSLKFEAKQRKDVSSEVDKQSARVGNSRPSATDARVNQRVADDDFDDSVPF